MAIRGILLRTLALGAVLLVGCGERRSGPIAVSAIGAAPALLNPNRQPPDAPAAFLLSATAQGLVRLDATGQVEPALAQSWTVSDDGLRYTFRIARGTWPDGAQITADQVVPRLRAAMARTSRNRLKPVLGAIAGIERMTESVLEITLKSPRPHFLQLLAQPDMAIIRANAGTGPYRADMDDGVLTLEDARPEVEDEEPGNRLIEIALRGETAALAVARFAEGEADLVTGGTAGDLPLARAANPAAAALRFDPVNGLFGLTIADNRGAMRDPAVRRALNMAIDRAAIVAALRVPDLLPRESLVPAGIPEMPVPALPDWSASPLPMRRSLAAEAIAGAAGGEARLTVRVAVPEGPGYRLIFALLRRDWNAIGVDAQAAAPGTRADLRLIDVTAPTSIAAWYLRHFTCAAGAICNSEADTALEAARNVPTAAERQAQLAAADRLLTDAAIFMPIAAPVRWSLVSQRLTGFQPNPFGTRFPGSLVARRR